MPNLLDLQSTDWTKEVVEETRPVLAEFWHHKCAGCKLMEPIMEKMPEILGDKVKIVRLNLLESKENRRFAIQGGIRSTPTFVVYCQGEPTGQIIGSLEEEDFITAVQLMVETAEKCVKGTPIQEE